jgi:alpha-acetolactate decarboxylase
MVSFVSILKPDGSTLVSDQIVGMFGNTITTTTPVAGNYTVVVDPMIQYTGSMMLAEQLDTSGFRYCLGR